MDKVCRLYNLKRHIVKVCRKTGVHSVKPDSLQDHSNIREDIYTIFELNNVSTLTPDVKVPLKIEGLPAEMQLDTGCAFTLAPKSLYDKLCSHLPLKPTEVILATYTGEKIKPLGQVNVDVEYASRNYSLSLLIVNVGTTPLFGINWLRKVNLYWHSLPGCRDGASCETYPKPRPDVLVKEAWDFVWFRVRMLQWPTWAT